MELKLAASQSSTFQQQSMHVIRETWPLPVCGAAGMWFCFKVPSVTIRTNSWWAFPFPLWSFGLWVLLLLQQHNRIRNRPEPKQDLNLYRGGTYRAAAGCTFFLVVGGWSDSLPGTRWWGWSFTAWLWRLRLRVLVFLRQGEQITEPDREGVT